MYSVGDKVTHVPSHGQSEKGIVKEVISEDKVRVVYKCNNDWHNFKDYTSALTNTKDLIPGWPSSESGEVH